MGSSRGDHRVETELLGQRFIIERIGTNGDYKAFCQKLGELDGKVNAIGIGGINLVLVAGRRPILSSRCRACRSRDAYAEMNGRSFATNVIQATLVALSDRQPEELGPADYPELMSAWDFDRASKGSPTALPASPAKSAILMVREGFRCDALSCVAIRLAMPPVSRRVLFVCARGRRCTCPGPSV